MSEWRWASVAAVSQLPEDLGETEWALRAVRWEVNCFRDQSLRPCNFPCGATKVASKRYSSYQTVPPIQSFPGSKKRKATLNETVRQLFPSSHPLDTATTWAGGGEMSAAGAAIGRCQRADKTVKERREQSNSGRKKTYKRNSS